MLGPVRIAIDIGGTFTDIQVVEERSGRTESHKTPTTPDNPAVGLVTGIQEVLLRLGIDKAQISGLMHGTTIATNAVLQRRFARAALVTTSGFEDVLEIGRHVRSDVYSQIAETRSLLIPRRLRFGIDERVDSSGSVITAPQREQVTELAAQLARGDINVVAIALLNSFANPDHEAQVAGWLTDQLPGVRISLSSTVSPEAREYERVSTTVLNALLMPVVGDYLDQLARRLADVGISAPVYLVQSNGGVTTPEIAAEQPVRLILSGPSGGARAVEVIAEQQQVPDLIAIDMGGTSFDVSVIRGGRARLQTQGDIDSIPVRVPMLEIRTIGAGGGSLARVDENRRLTVGPQSAGAQPGPVAYGRGGTEPTVSDANIALGRIDPDYFLGGSLSLDLDAARNAVAEKVAKPLNMDIDEAASGVIDIAVSHMAAAIRLSLFEKGLDPVDFSLVSFGGAGGLHAALVATELGARRILFPPDAGTQSAWGMLFANVMHDVSQSHLSVMDESAVGPLTETMSQLRNRAIQLLERSGIEPARQQFEVLFDMRYPGQGWEIGVASVHDQVSMGMIDAACEDFHRLHQEQFAHNDPDTTPELVTLRLRAIGQLSKPALAGIENRDGAPVKSQRKVFTDGQWQTLDIVDGMRLSPGETLSGPVMVEEPHSTVYLPAGWQARVDPTGLLIAEVSS